MSDHDSKELTGFGGQFYLRSSDDQIDQLRRDYQQQVLHWLDTTDGTNQALTQKTLSRTREPGTGRWFLDSPQFQAWISQSPNNGTFTGNLFCPGIPGAGKTIMTSLVVETLQNRFGMSDDFSIAYYYLGSAEGGTPRADQVLRSIAAQLIMWNKTTLLLDKQTHKAVASGHTAKTSQVQQLVIDAARSYGQVFIVLDGLDAFEDDDRLTLLQWMHDCQNLLPDHQNINVFATSRNATDFMPLRHDVLEIRAHPDDLALYLHHKLRSVRVVQRDPKLHADLTETIIERAGNM
ncbi:hypothetical protein QBC35DRAFT_476146 [Podospora australis]|uniref:Nephrocystin 3-like N-terminal domain-containing protein n=1 Tax=Podospora australis TaxID=1536484 RepID=A0AAN7AH89_9PEZI|nr:hypothetical protein QBC35DRAFT_476146 [Podospora australis]